MKQGWEIKKLGEIGNIYNGNSINAEEKKKKYTGVSGYPYIGTKDIGFDSVIDYNNGVNIPYNNNSFKIAHANSVLICMEGGSAGRKIGFVNQDICFGNKLLSITPNADICGKYVFYYLKSNAFIESFKELLTGIIGGVSIGKFKEIPIPVPPLDEQKEIVKKLDSISEKVRKVEENYKKVLEECDKLKQATLKNIFE